jgi:hypothetical protein
MKQLIILGGICLLTTVSFSQQVSSARSGEVKPLENNETTPIEVVPDSVATLHSMGRNGKSVTVPVTKETKSNTGKQTEKTTVVSSAKKPD